MTWLQAFCIGAVAGTPLFYGALWMNRYIGRHELQQVIGITNGIELSGEEGVWRAKPYPLCWDVLANRRWTPRQEIDGRYNCAAEEAGGI